MPALLASFAITTSSAEPGVATGEVEYFAAGERRTTSRTFRASDAWHVAYLWAEGLTARLNADVTAEAN